MKGNFQIIIIVVFIALAIFGVLVFSGAIPIGNSTSPGGLGTVVLWGTVKNDTMAPLLKDFNDANTNFVVKYVEKSLDTFDQDLLEALASGTGPDMIFLPDYLAFHYADKLVTIPYATYPLAAFKTNFATAGEVFLRADGVLAFPLSIDPLVMYYNRSMLDANGVVAPPAFWDDFANFVPAVTKKDESNKIIKSAVALGHFSNILHAKDIIATMFMQTGNPIITEKDGAIISTLNSPSSGANLSSAIKFYTSFANPNESVYSWNKSFSSSGDAFSKQDLALYFGYASELKALVNANPNEDFLAGPFPQVRNANFKLTGAHVTGISLLSSSKNFDTAFLAAGLMSSGDFASKFALANSVAPARRDLLAVKPEDAFSPTFYGSALFAKSWLDPSPKNTDDIFRRIIDGVLSNTVTPENAIVDASNKLSLLLLTNR